MKSRLTSLLVNLSLMFVCRRARWTKDWFWVTATIVVLLILLIKAFFFCFSFSICLMFSTRLAKIACGFQFHLETVQHLDRLQMKAVELGRFQFYRTDVLITATINHLWSKHSGKMKCVHLQGCQNNVFPRHLYDNQLFLNTYPFLTLELIILENKTYQSWTRLSMFLTKNTWYVSTQTALRGRATLIAFSWGLLTQHNWLPSSVNADAGNCAKRQMADWIFSTPPFSLFEYSFCPFSPLLRHFIILIPQAM